MRFTLPVYLTVSISSIDVKDVSFDSQDSCGHVPVEVQAGEALKCPCQAASRCHARAGYLCGSPQKLITIYLKTLKNRSQEIYLILSSSMSRSIGHSVEGYMFPIIVDVSSSYKILANIFGL